MTEDKLKYLTGDPTDQVPRVRAVRMGDEEVSEEPPFPSAVPDRKVEYYTISRDKWIQVESAFDAAQRIQKKIDSEFRSKTQNIMAGVTTHGSNEQYVVTVKIERLSSVDIHTLPTPEQTLDRLKEILPDEAVGQANTSASPSPHQADIDVESATVVEDIPIEYEFAIKTLEGCGVEKCDWLEDGAGHYTSVYRQSGISVDGVFTGSAIQTPNRNGNWSGRCTLGPRVRDSSGERMLFTNAHCVYDTDFESPLDAIGRLVGQPNEEYIIGEVKSITHSGQMDAALIELNRSYYATNQLASKTAGEANGILSSTVVGLDYLKDNTRTPICRQGARSGRCEGRLYAIRDRLGGHRIEILRDYHDGGGNSGGPYFIEENGELELVGMHQAGNETNPPSWDPAGPEPLAIGTYIGDLENEFDVNVI